MSGDGWAVLDLALAFAVGMVLGLLLAALAKERPRGEPVHTEDQ